MEIHISHSIVNLLTWFKALINLLSKAYMMCSKIWENNEVEKFTWFGKPNETVLFRCFQLEPDAHTATGWWMLELFQLKNTWNSSQLGMPLVVLEGNRAKSHDTVEVWWLKGTPNMVQMKEWWRRARGLWSFLQKFTQVQKCKMRGNGCFLVCGCCELGLFVQKQGFYISV